MSMKFAEVGALLMLEGENANAKNMIERTK
jgi:hypothetical protein